MEELLPGLVRVMEERLGRFGRPLTTFLVICLALGACAWGIKLFLDNLVFPLAQFIQSVIVNEEISLKQIRGVAISIGIYIALVIPFFFIMQAIWNRKVKKPSEALLEKTQDVFQKAKETQRLTIQTYQKTKKAYNKLVKEVAKLESKHDNELHQNTGDE